MTVPQITQFLANLGINGQPNKHLTQIIHQLLELKIAASEAKAVAAQLKEKPRCCGSEYIDPKGFMYANHGLNDVCPLHGQHPKQPGKKRLRQYVGNKPEAMQEVYEAMENWSTWHKAQREAATARRRFEQATERIKHAYNHL
jgi:hypothetical protein